MKTFLRFPLAVLCGICLFSCSSVVEVEPTVRYVQAFNSSVQISVYDTTLNSAKISNALKKFEKKLLSLDKMANSTDPQGTLYQLNHSKKLEWTIPKALKPLLVQAIKWSKKSDGVFDITIKPLTELYNWGDDFSPPDEKALRRALRKVNYKKLKWRGEKLYRGNAQIDLEYIIKGYALNEASGILLERNFNDFLINATGVIQFHWTHPDVPATIYVRHPRKPGKYFGQFKLNHSCGLATAADYQRYNIFDGKRYHHLISPFTGKPENKCVAVTVKASNAYVANYYANYLYLLGHEKARNITLDNHSIEAIIIWEGENGLKYWVSPGFAKIFEVNEL